MSESRFQVEPSTQCYDIYTLGAGLLRRLGAQHIFLACFSGAILYHLVLRVGGVTNIKFGEQMGQSWVLPTHLFSFRYVASFQNEGD